MDQNEGQEKFYKHVSSLHKCNQPGSTTVTFVDNKGSHVDKNGSHVKIEPKRRRADTSAANDNCNKVVSASKIRKISNPFVWDISFVDIAGHGKATWNIIDKNLQVQEKCPRSGSKQVDMVEDVAETLKPAPERKSFSTAMPTAAPQPSPALPMEPKRFMWQDCNFSKNLIDGAPVSTCFMWNIYTFQIVADVDQDAIEACQAKIASFVQSGKTMNRPPVKDEMVVGQHLGEFYRGRVLQVDGEICTVSFVDFGDKCTYLKYAMLYAVDEELMKDPIYSARVILEGVKAFKIKVKVGRKLNAMVYGSLTLQICDKIVVDDSDAFRAILWTSQGRQLNHVVSEVITSLEVGIGTGKKSRK